MWTLCEALWGRLGTTEPEPGTSGYLQQLERRRSFSAWLSRSATQRIEQEVGLSQAGGHVEAIFSYLTGHCISDACRLAQKSGEERGDWSWGRSQFEGIGKRGRGTEIRKKRE